MRYFLFAILALILTGAVNDDRAVEANRAYEAGEYERAEAIYRELLDNNPDSPQLLFNYGSALARQGKTEESIRVFERYREQTTDASGRAPAEYNLGYLHEEAGDTENALNHFRQAIDLDPDDEDAKYNYELLKRRQQETPPEDEEEDDDDEEQEQEQQPEPQSGQPPPADDNGQQQDGETREDITPLDENPQNEEQQRESMPEISTEQLRHAEDIMNALEQIEKDLIKDFKKRQFDPADPQEKDW